MVSEIFEKAHMKLIQNSFMQQTFFQRCFNCLVYTTVIGVPLIFTPFTFLVFELPKTMFFRTTTLLLFITAIWHILKSDTISFFSFKNQKILGISLSVLIVSFIIATITSITPSLSFWGEYHKLQGLFTWMHIFLWTWLVTVFLKKENIAKILYALVAGSTIISTYAIIQKFGIDPISSWESEVLLGRVFSTLGQPNYLGSYLVTTIPITGGLLLQHIVEKSATKYRKFFLSMNLVIQIIALVLTLSRGAWIGLFLGSLIGISIWSFVFRKNIAKKLLITAVTLLLIVVAMNLSQNFTPLNNIPIIGRLILTRDNLRSIESRIFIWKSALNTIKEHPWFGNGPETFFMTFTKYQSPELLKLEAFTETADRAHNQILDMATNIGIIATLAYYFFLTTLLIKITLLLKVYENRRFILISLFISIISLEITHLFGFALISHLMILWLMIGILLNHIIDFKERKIIKIKSGTRILVLSIITLFASWIILSFNIIPLFADYYFNKGKFILENRSIPKGAILYEKTVSLNPHQHFYWLHLANAYILLLSQEENGKIMKKAEYTINEAEKRASKDYNVLLLKGKIALEKAKNDLTSQETVYRIFEEGLTLAPLNPHLHRAYAESAYEFGDYEKAILLYEKLLAISPGYVMKETHALSKEEKNKARIFYKLNPDFKKAFLYLARSYSKIEKYKQALGYLQYADIDIDTLTTYATIYARLGDDEKAKNYTLKAIELDPHNPLLQENLKKLE